MQDTYLVRTFWDNEAGVWVASGMNFVGLAAESETVDGLLQKIPDMISDLVEVNDKIACGEVPIQLLVEAQQRHYGKELPTHRNLL